MRREETEGASLREGSAEVALEQWTERTAVVEAGVSVDFNAVSALEEKRYRRSSSLIFPYRVSAGIFPEFRW